MRDINKIKNLVIRKFRGNVYYFNEDGIYCKTKCVDLKQGDFDNVYFRPDGTFYIDECPFIRKNINQNLNIARKAISKLEVGQTIKEFEEIVKNTRINEINYEGLERFITKIDKPIFGRCPENKNKNTFDFIFVDVCIISEWEEDKIQYINKNIQEIKVKVLDKIGSSKTFLKYGIPLNFLKITKVTLKKDSVLQFVLELKSI